MVYNRNKYKFGKELIIKNENNYLGEDENIDYGKFYNFFSEIKSL